MRFGNSSSMCAVAIVLATLPAVANAQSTATTASTSAAAEAVSEAIIVTGTRMSGMRAADSPAPVQILATEALEATGSPDLVQSLAQNLPSIQAQSFGSDLQAHSMQMKLRGLSPNHTLILINGKRRRGTANLAVSGGPYGGSAAPDISFIPTEAVGHVEVLQDGAAAQYGTDAIAGVINFITKKQDSGGQLSATVGEYMDEGGQTYSISGNVGFAPIENSYVNLTLQKKKKDFSFRGAEDPRVWGPNGIADLALENYPDLVNNPDYPFVNRIAGDPYINQTVAFVSAGYDFGSVELYGFGNYGKKYARAFENYRTPNIVRFEGEPLFPQGFSPLQAVHQTDYAATIGLKGVSGDLGFDIASTYGKDLMHVYVQNSANATLYAETGYTPTEFYNGSFKVTQWSNTVDLTYPVELGLSEPMNIAGGLEFRRDTYSISPGDPASYYGSGAQSFFGYGPNNAGSYSRKNFSQYLDLSLKPTAEWLVNAAVRHENYSDFGDTTVYKLTSRYDFTSAFAVRGTVSTGFRAPSLAEGNYSGINVGPNGVSGVLAANSAAATSLGFGALKPEKSTNYSLGLVFKPAPRMSITIDAYSIKIRDRIMTTGNISGFSGRYCPEGYDGENAENCYVYDLDYDSIYNQQVVYDAVAAALGGTIPEYVTTLANGDRNMQGSVGIQTFVNGSDVRTRGIDLSMLYSIPADFGTFNLSFTANYNENKVTRIYGMPAELYTSPSRPALTALSTIYGVWQMENSTPKFRASLNVRFESGPFSANLRNNFYSQVSELIRSAGDSPLKGADLIVPVKASVITDLELGYKLTPAVKFSLGANNIFNKYPTERSYENIRGPQLTSGTSGYSSNRYPSFSPFGYNGGYYYGRINVGF